MYMNLGIWSFLLENFAGYSYLKILLAKRKSSCNPTSRSRGQLVRQYSPILYLWRRLQRAAPNNIKLFRMILGLEILRRAFHNRCQFSIWTFSTEMQMVARKIIFKQSICNKINVFVPCLCCHNSARFGHLLPVIVGHGMTARRMMWCTCGLQCTALAQHSQTWLRNDMHKE